MRFQTIQTQLQSLETRLIHGNTYENVLALKGEITSLIVSFNNIERTNFSEAPEAILAVKHNIRNLRESYRTKIQNLRPACVPPVVNIYTLFKQDSIREIVGIPFNNFFQSTTNYVRLAPDNPIFSSGLLSIQPEQARCYSSHSTLEDELAEPLDHSDSDSNSDYQDSPCELLIKLNNIIKRSKILYQNKVKEGIDSDYKDVPTRKPENEPQPYVCIMDEDIGGYYVWGPEYEFDSYTRYLLSTVRPEYPLEETEHYQQSISSTIQTSGQVIAPEPKEDADSDYKDVTFRKSQNQLEPYIANIPGSDFKRVS